MTDFASAGIALEMFCFTLIRFPLICGAGLCTLAAGIWFRAELLEENVQLIRNTPIQSLPDAVDSLHAQAAESEGLITTAFVVTRGFIVPAESSVIPLDGPSGGYAVYLRSFISTTPLGGGYLGLVDSDATVREHNHQLVLPQSITPAIIFTIATRPCDLHQLHF